MADRPSFAPRSFVDPFLDALHALAGVTVASVTPRYAAHGGTWVIEVQCATQTAKEEAFRLYARDSRDWPPGAVTLHAVMG